MKQSSLGLTWVVDLRETKAVDMLEAPVCVGDGGSWCVSVKIYCFALDLNLTDENWLIFPLR